MLSPHEILRSPTSQYAKTAEVVDVSEHSDGYTTYKVQIQVGFKSEPYFFVAQKLLLILDSVPMKSTCGTTLKIEEHNFQVIPANCIDEDPFKYYFVTRYKDLWRLWRRVHLVHQQLHLRGNFPQLAKPTLFGEFLTQKLICFCTESRFR